MPSSGVKPVKKAINKQQFSCKRNQFSIWAWPRKMANLILSNLTNTTMRDEGKYIFSAVFISITIILNTIACPFSIGLNLLVIMAIKRRTRLQCNSNIMLACLAVTDVLSGLTTQPSFLLWQAFFLFGSDVADVFSAIHKLCIVVLSNSSALHLMMVVEEKVRAIKYSFRYPYIVTPRNTKTGVLFCWVYSSSLGIVLQMMGGRSALYYLWVSHILFVCVVFVSCAYMFLYSESRRHQKMIKAQQLSQEQVKTFLKESKAVKTTVFVVGAVGLCLLPAVVHLGFGASRLFMF